MAAKINKEMTISEILSVSPEIANVLVREGMHCITCEAATGETLREAGAVHGMAEDDIDDLVDRINDFLTII